MKIIISERAYIMRKPKVDWSKYTKDNPRITAFKRATAFWKEDGIIKQMVYARWVWEHYNGEIPKGYCIHHADGNSLNDNMYNLVCVTPKEHRVLHRKLRLLRAPVIKTLKVKHKLLKHRVYGTRPEDFVQL